MGKKHKKKHDRVSSGKAGAAPLMGLAGMVMRQAGTPEGRQMIAMGLRAAADAIGGGGARRATGAMPQAPVPPVPPVPPTPPKAETSDVKPGDPGTRSGQASMPPEVARIMGVAGAALERWASAIGQPPRSDVPTDRKPH